MPVDLSPHLRFIRSQTGLGCWGYATLACWDIMNDMACPYSPNLSMRLWLWLFQDRPFLKHTCDRGVWAVQDTGVVKTPAGYTVPVDSSPEFSSSALPQFLQTLPPVWHTIAWPFVPDPAMPGTYRYPSFFSVFGNTTEGADRTRAAYHVSGLSKENEAEAVNFRLKGDPQKIPLTTQAFITALASGHPIRIAGGNHVMAVVGYDDTVVPPVFKFVNSWGDAWGDGGYGTFTFDTLSNGQAVNGLNAPIREALTFEIEVPKPVPVARIHLRHTNRANVHLWLSVQGTARKMKIWPQEWDEHNQGRDLHFTVPLPTWLRWPPVPGQALKLELLDTGEYSNSGGSLVEFTIAFNNTVIPHPTLLAGPKAFAPGGLISLSHT